VGPGDAAQLAALAVALLLASLFASM